MPQVYNSGFKHFPGKSFHSGAAHCEANRLATFSCWPANHHLFPIKLARHGFQYSGSGDRVECWFCGFSGQDWQIGDADPVHTHKAAEPNCPINRGQAVDGAEASYTQVDRIHSKPPARSGARSNEDVGASGKDEASSIVFSQNSGVLAGKVNLRPNVPIPISRFRLRQPRTHTQSGESFEASTRVAPEDFARVASEVSARVVSEASVRVVSEVSARVVLEASARVVSEASARVVSHVRPSGGEQAIAGARQDDPATAGRTSTSQGDPDEGPVIDLRAERYKREMGVTMREHRCQSNRQQMRQESESRTVVQTDEDLLRTTEIGVQQERTESLDPLFPTYSSLQSRINSYSLGFPSQLRHLSLRLSDLGFFYTGYEDIAICWVCGVMMHRWQESDIPEHNHTSERGADLRIYTPWRLSLRLEIANDC